MMFLPSWWIEVKERRRVRRRRNGNESNDNLNTGNSNNDNNDFNLVRSNLKANEQKLTTHEDLYEALVDIVKTDVFNKEANVNEVYEVVYGVTINATKSNDTESDAAAAMEKCIQPSPRITTAGTYNASAISPNPTDASYRKTRYCSAHGISLFEEIPSNRPLESLGLWQTCMCEECEFGGALWASG